MPTTAPAPRPSESESESAPAPAPTSPLPLVAVLPRASSSCCAASRASFKAVQPSDDFAARQAPYALVAATSPSLAAAFAVAMSLSVASAAASLPRSFSHAPPPCYDKPAFPSACAKFRHVRVVLCASPQRTPPVGPECACGAAHMMLTETVI